MAKKMTPQGIARYFLDSFDLLPHDQWLELRKTKVTASEVGCLVGYNKWATAFDIFEEKVFNKVRPSSLTMERGKYLEPLIAEEYARRTGAQLIAPWEIINGERHERLLEHPTDPLRACTPDYFAVTKDTFKYLEIKDVSFYGQVNWLEGLPEGYHLQVQYNLNVINSYLRKIGQPPVTCDLAYWWNDRVEIVPDIKEDAERVEILAQVAKDFYNNYVAPKIYPPPERWHQAKTYYGSSYTDSVIQSTPAIDRLLIMIASQQDKVKELKSEAKALEDSIEQTKLLVAEHMKTNEILVSLGETVATWKPDKNGTRVLNIKYKVLNERGMEGW